MYYSPTKLERLYNWLGTKNVCLTKEANRIGFNYLMHWQNRSTLHPLNLMWGGRKILTDSNTFWKEIHSPYIAGILLHPGPTIDPSVGMITYYLLRGASHYHGQGSRGCQFSPIILQETKSSASRSFTLMPKSKGRHNLKWLLLEEGDGPSKEVWIG
jgi:hypothetical protein